MGEPVRAGPVQAGLVHTGYLQSQRTPALTAWCNGVGYPWPSAPAGHRKTLGCCCKLYVHSGMLNNRGAPAVRL